MYICLVVVVLCKIKCRGSDCKGPKVGRLFLLKFIIPRTLSLACMIVENKVEVLHRWLGHPNDVF